MPPRIPSPIPGVDVMSMPLSTIEGFVLSRIDGTSKVEDISIMTSVDEERLLRILDRLAELGAVSLPWKPVGPSRASTRGAPIRPGEPPAATEPDEPDPDEPDVQLPAALRRRINDTHRDMAGKDHYAVLGVARDADRKTIRTAYFLLAKVFHTDSQFGKKLGSYGPKMEAVFGRLTEAYEVLSKSRRRTEYDDYLAQTEHASQARRSLEHGKRVRDTARFSQEVQRPESVTPAPPPSSKPPARTSVRPRATEEERRERARVRILQRFASMPPQRQPHSAPPARRRGAIDDLTRSLKQTASVTKQGPSTASRIEHHLANAREAEAGGDIVAAANELQEALSLEPTRDDITAEHDRVTRLVAASLADNYASQAEYEEKTGKFDAAAASWAKVSDSRPEDARAARSAASNLLKADGDLHRAQRYAQRAVRLGPDDVDNLIVLARVYLEAGLRLNAVRELEKAAKLDPANELVEDLLREAR